MFKLDIKIIFYKGKLFVCYRKIESHVGQFNGIPCQNLFTGWESVVLFALTEW